MKKLIVSAGGKSSRIRQLLKEFSPDMRAPKHLLPLGSYCTTIIGLIVERALQYFDMVELSVSEHTELLFRAAFALEPRVEIIVDRIHSGPLGPMMREFMVTNQRVFGCAGDFFHEFDWGNFIDFHESHGCPISILISRSFPTTKGARFHLERGVVVGWERVPKTEGADLINIGAYIVDPCHDTITLLRAIRQHKEDNFFDLCIPRGLVAGYNPLPFGFNVNTPQTFHDLSLFLK